MKLKKRIYHSIKNKALGDYKISISIWSCLLHKGITRIIPKPVHLLYERMEENGVVKV